MVAYGLRNPFRMTQRPGSDELWIGDVGWNTWEEIQRLVSPASSTASNFGWPAMRDRQHKAVTRVPASVSAHPCARRLVRSSRRTTRTTAALAW
jgi:glucose/arabinose dehydrogenase